jgi:hypothetical protein
VQMPNAGAECRSTECGCRSDAGAVPVQVPVRSASAGAGV